MLIDYREQQRLINLVLKQSNQEGMDNDQAVRRNILNTVATAYTGTSLTFEDRKQVAAVLFDAMRGMDILQPLIDDYDITEIMVNGPGTVFIERKGRICDSGVRFHDRNHLEGFIANLFGRANRLIHEKKPLADMRLDGGERVHAALPPAAPDGPVLNIRKFTGIRQDMPALVESGFASDLAADYLQQAVSDKQSIFICGGTNTGKTTLLNILSGFIDGHERLITIEDAAELSLQNHDNLVRLESRQPGPDGDGEISLSALIRAALRMRPDRIIVGEVRGPEAYDMIQAMHTGHAGSLCTGHGNSCHDMLERLCLMVMLSIRLPWDVVRRLVASALDLVIHLSRTNAGKRQIHAVARLLPPDDSGFRLQWIFKRTSEGELQHVQ